MMVKSRLNDPSDGLENSGRRVLTYADLRARYRGVDGRPPTREIELHLTGNMERFIWGKHAGERMACLSEAAERWSMNLCSALKANLDPTASLRNCNAVHPAQSFTSTSGKSISVLATSLT
jgi:hypothetical protein